MLLSCFKFNQIVKKKNKMCMNKIKRKKYTEKKFFFRGAFTNSNGQNEKYYHNNNAVAMAEKPS